MLSSISSCLIFTANTFWVKRPWKRKTKTLRVAKMFQRIYETGYHVNQISRPSW
jgi:hypothetical protein